jgi:hypothetical protein
VCIISRIPDGEKTGGRGKRDKLLTLVAQGTPNFWCPSEFGIIVALHLRDAYACMRVYGPSPVQGLHGAT